MTEHIEIGRDGGVQTIRMNRPDKKNALTRAMYAAMAAALTGGDDDPDIRCHLLMGVPGAFTSGNDIADFMAIAMGGEGGREVGDFLLALATAKKPVLSAVDGIAVGVGATIHFHCDLTWATPRTNFHTSFVDLGLVPEAGSSLLAPRLMGRQGAFAMLGLAEPLPAEKALAMGFIHTVVSEDELEAAALEGARRVAAKPPKALRIARDLMLGDRAELVERIRVESDHFRQRLRSEEAKAAFTAFMSRKK
ncbi:MAG: crotonase/enoyl-CoA hydratase family protein [Rhizobiaceae bacterium]|nr:crotonase/enoyl-CoA hydratase family protein [Rhizobiaceae bacterium]MCV0406208.1 crotonase/enoyl-CoA hydratase family protein [Rhizobiaceae bacterium]